MSAEQLNFKHSVNGCLIDYKIYIGVIPLTIKNYTQQMEIMLQICSKMAFKCHENLCIAKGGVLLTNK